MSLGASALKDSGGQMLTAERWYPWQTTKLHLHTDLFREEYMYVHVHDNTMYLKKTHKLKKPLATQ